MSASLSSEMLASRCPTPHQFITDAAADAAGVGDWRGDATRKSNQLMDVGGARRFKETLAWISTYQAPIWAKGMHDGMVPLLRLKLSLDLDREQEFN